MSNFKPGDRVRIVRNRNPEFPELTGREATILRAVGPYDFLAQSDWVLRVDGCAAEVGAPSDFLEPILPTPCAADILAMERLPDFTILAPLVEVRP